MDGGKGQNPVWEPFFIGRIRLRADLQAAGLCHRRSGECYKSWDQPEKRNSTNWTDRMWKNKPNAAGQLLFSKGDPIHGQTDQRDQF